MSTRHTNPFPGLRPFLFHEHDLFFGREEQYEQMVGKLSTTRFLAVVGTSGSGKSSLVRAGLLPALYGGLMMSAGSHWRVALFRPKDDPIRELAQALNHRRVFGADFKTNGTSLLSVGDVIDWPSLCVRLTDDAGKALPSPSRRILELLPNEMRQTIQSARQKEDFEQVYKSEFVNAFNTVITRPEFYQEQSFEKITIPGEAQRLLIRGQANLSHREIETLNRLLLEASYPQEIAQDGEIQTKITEVTLRRGDLGLIEAVRQARMAAGENLLIVVDQFEELFRYARISENGPHGNQAAAFVKLLLEAKSQKEIPIYVVLTMRSDYLGDCAKFWDLPEAINEGQYLTPRLTRDQRREAIVGPIKERGADIAPLLVNQLLNEMGDSPDQLPILQHALMRTWDQWEKDHKDNEPIDIRHYDAIGRMTEALSRHADEAFKDLPDERSQELAKKIFKCLTERGSRNREIRRPTALREIRAVTKAKVRELVPVINVFRQEGRSFLMPSPKKPLNRNTLIDISHESLIRNWVRLKDWVQEEARAAGAYRRLVESSKLYAKGKSSLLPELEVQYGLTWREENQPNQAWASRYHPFLNEGINKSSDGSRSEQEKNLRDEKIFKSAIAFLEESRKTRKQEREDQEKQRRDKLKRARVVAGVFLALSIGCLVALIFLWAFKKEADANSERAIASEKRTDLSIYTFNISSSQIAFAQENFATAYDSLKPLREKKYDPLRGFEWDLLTTTCAQDLHVEMPHVDRVLATAFLSDRKVLATASADGALKFWKVNPQGATLDSEKQLESASLMAFSSDGGTIATVNGARNMIKVQNTTTFAEDQMRIEEKDQYQEVIVQLISISPDGSKVVGSLMASSPKAKDLPGRIEKVVVWDIPTKKPTMIAENSADANVHFTALALSKENNLAIGFSDGSVRLWNQKTGQMSLPFKVSAKAHGIPRGRLVDEISKSNNGVQALAFSQDQEILVSGTINGVLTLWNVKGQNSLPYRIQHSYPISSLAFSPDRKTLAASSYNGSATLWDTSTLKVSAVGVPELPDSKVLKGHSGAVLSMAFVPGTSMIVTTSDDKTTRLWDMAKKGKAKIQPATSYHYDYPTFIQDATGEMLAIQQFKNGSSTLSFAHNRSEGLSESPEFYTPDPKGISREFAKVSSVAFSSEPILSVYRTENGKGIIKLWVINKQGNSPTLTHVKEWTAPLTNISASTFSSDGKTLATWSPEAGIKFYDVATGKETVTRPTTQSKQNFGASSFSPDLSMFVQSVGSKLTVFDIKTGKGDRVMDSSSDLYSLAFSSDGKTLATGHADKTVRLWDTSTWENPKILNGHIAPVDALVFSRDNKRLATGSRDGVIKLWDISDENWNMNEELVKLLRLRRELVTILRGGDNSGVRTLAFSQDNKSLISAYANGTIRIVGTS